MLNVKLSTTYHLVTVLLVTPEIHSDSATHLLLNQVRTLKFVENLCNIPTFLNFSVNEPTDPCQPNPCGPNSQCRNVNGQSVCSCLPNYIGSPPSCRPECTVSSECDLNRACVNQKCIDPCPGTCGLNADCQVSNHNPICSCKPVMTGDPFFRCYSIPRKY